MLPLRPRRHQSGRWFPAFPRAGLKLISPMTSLRMRFVKRFTHVTVVLRHGERSAAKGLRVFVDTMSDALPTTVTVLDAYPCRRPHLCSAVVKALASSPSLMIPALKELTVRLTTAEDIELMAKALTS